MRRHVLGAIALSALLLGAAFYLAGHDSGRHLEWSSVLVRVGAILGAVWLAMPELGRPTNRWLIIAFLALFVVIVWRPRLFLYAAVAAVVILILRPRMSSTRHEPIR